MKSSKQKLHRFCLSIALGVVSAVCVAAQSSRDESQTAPTTGAITGQVVSETGQPLPGAAVYVRTYGGAGQGRSTSTDAEGNFQVTGLEALAYIVSASLSPYVTPPRDPDSTQAPYYRVGDPVRLQLIKGGVITGIVTTSAGEPVVGVRVQAYMIRDGNGQPARYGVPYRERTTDDSGIYRIYGLSAGTYVVSAGGVGNFSGFNANPYDTDTPTYAPSSTRDTAMEVNLQAGGEASNVDIRYRGEPGHIISGSAIDPAATTAPSGFTIFLNPISNGVSQWSNSSYQPPGSRGFSFYGIADGDYDVVAQTYFPGGELALSEPRRVKVRGADITGVELTVKPLGSITGHVALEESKAAECKGKRRPLFGETLITPWHNEKTANKDQPQFPWSLGVPAFPDKQGDFTLRNLAPGQYRLHTRPFAKYWYLQSISLRPSIAPTAKAAQANRPVDAARNWTTLKVGDRVTGFVITLAEGAASLKGQIKVAEGQKMPPKLFIYLAPAEPQKAEDVLRFFASLVAADGSFALNNLPPGRYWAIAKAAGENESNMLSKLRLPDDAEA
ncbi:MAG: carboxypeptidase-like regulatory domain-containing protein, partial [Acidobacteriota bacterium]|nr:carboxypeptidase-like regulatory domain-containing protein [Acidobacteriota bacterium]